MKELWLSRGDLALMESADPELLVLILKQKSDKYCCQFKRTKGRMSYQCSRCGRQIYPLSGTIFEKTTTELAIWRIFMEEMFDNSNIGITDCLELVDFDISYTTAHRMYHLIKNNIKGLKIKISTKNT